MRQRRTCYTVRQRIYSFKVGTRLQRICFHYPGEYENYYVKLNERFYAGKYHYSHSTTGRKKTRSVINRLNLLKLKIHTQCASSDGSLQSVYQVL
jgi:hypothetical protein